MYNNILLKLTQCLPVCWFLFVSEVEVFKKHYPGPGLWYFYLLKPSRRPPAPSSFFFFKPRTLPGFSDLFRFSHFIPELIGFQSSYYDSILRTWFSMNLKQWKNIRAVSFCFDITNVSLALLNQPLTAPIISHE